MVLDEIDKEIFRDIAKETKRIADAFEKAIKEPEEDPRVVEAFDCMRKAMDQGMKEWDKVTDLEKRIAVLESDDIGTPPTVGDVVDEPDPDPDHCSCGDPLCPDYNPEDDAEECPNCGEGKVYGVMDHGGDTGALCCKACHHVWTPITEVP